MSEPLDPTLAGLNDCGCCAGVSEQTPATIDNRPGLDRIAYRVGTHADFRQSLLAALSTLSDPALAPLRGLTTREDDDFTIALLDSWSALADVLTFYQERVANESYLRTAGERFSVLELARLIGYELRPGVAAATWLAFTLDETPGAPSQITLDPGVKVQSTPGPDEKPQTFETIESIEARVAWNALAARTTELKLPTFGDATVWLQGTATNLKPGDLLLLVGPERDSDPTSDNWDVRRVTTVAPNHDRNQTLISWQPALGSSSPFKTPSANPRVYALRQRASLFGHNAPAWSTLSAALRFGESVWDGSKWVFLAGPFAGSQYSWAEAALAANATEVWLDATYSTVTRGSWMVLASQNYVELYSVTNVVEESHAAFNLSARVTRLGISGENTNQFSPRNAAVYLQSELLEIAESPIDEPVRGAQVRLASQADVPLGRRLAASGKRAVVEVIGKGNPLRFERKDGSLIRLLNRGERLFELEAQSLSGSIRWHLLDANGVDGWTTSSVADIVRTPAAKDDPLVFEVVELFALEADDLFHSRVVLRTPLVNVYDRRSFSLCANVAAATHGETVLEEVLGSGDATQSFQAFALRQPPLTFLRSEQFPGFTSTLQLRVNNLLWHESSTLFGHGPQERIFTARRNDDGKTSVAFGDGVTGARLPTGVDNVRAVYRKGLGLDGNVKAGQLNLLMSRPLGLKAAINPLNAEGGVDPESLDDARRNAPLPVLTLGRVVSLEDFENFARAYPGVAKALATWTWDGHSKGVFLTVAGPNGAAISEGGDVAIKLLHALRAAGEPFVSVRLKSFRSATFKVTGGLVVDPDYVPKQVLADVKAALAKTFSFAVRDFGRPVRLSEVVESIHSVSGVVAVDVDQLYRTGLAPALNNRLLADLPAGGVGNAQAAELLTLDADGAVGLEVRS